MKSKKKIKRKIKRHITTKKSKQKLQVPKVGDKVKITIKYAGKYSGKTATGIVKLVLTKKKYHSRGHKVLLSSGKIGRVTEILKTDKSTKKKCSNCGKKY